MWCYFYKYYKYKVSVPYGSWTSARSNRVMVFLPLSATLLGSLKAVTLLAVPHCARWGEGCRRLLLARPTPGTNRPQENSVPSPSAQEAGTEQRTFYPEGRPQMRNPDKGNPIGKEAGSFSVPRRAGRLPHPRPHPRRPERRWSLGFGRRHRHRRLQMRGRRKKGRLT